MKDSGSKDRRGIEPQNPQQNSLGIWAVIAVASVIAAGVVGYLVWTTSDTSMPKSGYVAMAAGVIFSLVVGVGLMALIFYSSRRGYDEPPVFIQDPADDRDEATPLEGGRHGPASDDTKGSGSVNWRTQ